MSPLRLLILLAAISVGTVSAALPKRPRNGSCRISRAKADRCAMDVMVFGNRETQYPSTMEEGWKFCKKVTDGINCLARFKNCVTGFKRNLVGSFVSYIKKEVKGICNEEILPLFISQLACLDKEKVRTEEFVKCVDRHVIMTDYVLAKVPPNDRFSAICCANAYYRKCYQRFTEEICTHIVGEEAAKFLDDFVVKVHSNLPTCSDKFESIEACARNLPDHNQRFAFVAADYNVPPQNHTVLLTFLDIFST